MSLGSDEHMSPKKFDKDLDLLITHFNSTKPVKEGIPQKETMNL